VLSATTALLRPDLINGPAVMVGSMQGTALVVLVVALPVLALAMAVARRGGGVRAIAGWTGAVAFLAYQGWMFLFAIPFNGLFLVYVVMFGCGFWALVVLALRTPAASLAAGFDPALPARVLAGWMIVSCLAFYGLWLKNVVPASLDSTAPAFLAGTGMVTPTNYVLDMALFLPFTLLVSVALWRRTAWGLVLGGAMLLALTLEAAAIAADQWMGAAADPGSPVASAAMTPVFGAVALITLVATGAWYRASQRRDAPARSISSTAASSASRE
jgi:hypothetical protein